MTDQDHIDALVPTAPDTARLREIAVTLRLHALGRDACEIGCRGMDEAAGDKHAAEAVKLRGQANDIEALLDAADQRDALRSELAKLSKPSVASMYGFQAGLGEAQDVLDELEKLRTRVEALERFVKHDELCSLIGGYGYCNCGLDALLKKDKS